MGKEDLQCGEGLNSAETKNRVIFKCWDEIGGHWGGGGCQCD